MLLTHQIEQFIFSERRTTLRDLERQFGLSEGECREELKQILPFGVVVREDGFVTFE